MDIANKRIVSQWNRKTFVHCEHALGDEGFNMIKFFAGIREDGKTTQSFRHFLTIPEARLLCYEIMTGRLENWVSSKGSRQGNHYLYRGMTIRKDEGKFFMIVGEGPGLEGPNGIILKDPKAPKETFGWATIRFMETELLQFALEVQAWLNAIATVTALVELDGSNLKGVSNEGQD